MGEHKSAKTLEIVQFLKEIGECLNYVVKIEDKMFPGKRTSPILDLTWRRYENQRSPIFIFEIDSTPEKSASDNALKIFSKPTEQFQKPLFFFHVFVKQKNQTDRIDSLKSEYNKSNYDVYLLSIHGSSSKLLYDILEQHFKIDKFVDLQNLLILLEERNPLNVKTEVILEKLIQLDFDKIPGTGFLSTLESFLIHKEYKFIKPFYCNYLKRYLEFDQSIEQNYPPYYTIRYSKITHIAIGVLLKIINYDDAFDRLNELDLKWQPWELWAPYFGLSQDHDYVMLSEFPLLLTLLCVAFLDHGQARYFSQKFQSILHKYGKFDKNSSHGFYWLLVSSIIAGDKDSFDYACSLISKSGGFNNSWFNSPSTHALEEYENEIYDDPRIPNYENWAQYMTDIGYKTEKIDYLKEIIESFLLMDNWEHARKQFGLFCIQQSILRNTK